MPAPGSEEPIIVNPIVFLVIPSLAVPDVPAPKVSSAGSSLITVGTLSAGFEEPLDPFDPLDPLELLELLESLELIGLIALLLPLESSDFLVAGTVQLKYKTENKINIVTMKNPIFFLT
jgi:hypothetical protein